LSVRCCQQVEYSMKKLTAEWIEKAEGDFTVSTRESKAPDPVYDVICYHCHQCIEKYLKAILVENSADFEKIHDLEALGYLCRDFLPSIEHQREGLIWLTQFSVRVRYPGFSATKADTKKALSVARTLRLLIRRFFSLPD
jgi:HEPN domain-containing protein